MRKGYVVLFFLAAAWQGALASTPSQQTRSVAGNLVLPEGRKLPTDTIVALRAIDGSRATTLARPDGTFKFYNVADGTYYVEVEALGWQFLSMKAVVKGATVKASSPDVPTATDIPYPLRIPALGVVSYFEERQPFNIIGWLKTPYGAMIAFMIGSMVLMPMLKVDPEEYKEMQEEKKKLTSAITGRGRE